MNSKRLILCLAAAAIAACLLIFAFSDRRLPVSESLNPVDGTDQSARKDRKDVASPPSTNEQEQSDARIAGSKIGQQFEDAILNGSKIDDFIRKHLGQAESGDSDSAHYLAEAMRYCGMELQLLEISFNEYNTQGSKNRGDLEAMAQVVMDGLVGQPEFYLREARRHLDRGIACKSLELESQELYRQAELWDRTAIDRRQPIALARAAMLKPNGANVTTERLNHSKEVLRYALSRSRDLMTFTYASSVVAAATGRDYTTERLAWAILACDYEDCGTLNYLYRGKCESMELRRTARCSDSMTDLDYLYMKYPNEFNVARNRASELYRALEEKDWTTVGLN